VTGGAKYGTEGSQGKVDSTKDRAAAEPGRATTARQRGTQTSPATFHQSAEFFVQLTARALLARPRKVAPLSLLLQRHHLRAETSEPCQQSGDNGSASTDYDPSDSSLFVALVAFVVASLVDRGSLRNAVIVTPPHNVRTLWKVEDALHGFPF
jgi:hypothetical protein